LPVSLAFYIFVVIMMIIIGPIDPTGI